MPGGELSKMDCEALCGSGQLYQCVSNNCTAATTGLPLAKCDANCGMLRSNTTNATTLWCVNGTFV